MREDYCSTSQKSIINDEPTEMIEHNEQILVENLRDDNETSKKSKRQRTTKSFGDDFIVYLVDDTPRTIEEAYSSLDVDYWKEAIKSELDSIMSNETWEVVSRPYGCKWVFKEKLRLDGTIEKYKTRLVAKGYNQKRRRRFLLHLLTCCPTDHYSSAAFSGNLIWSSRSSDGR
jgi:hypothetical protein